MSSKKELRAEMKAKLSKISDEAHHQLSLLVSNNLIKFLNDLGVFQKKLIIGVFSPIEKEPDWFVMMVEGKEKIETAYPAIADDKMVFKLARMDELLANHDFGVNILSPQVEAKLVTPDIVIVPGLGFSATGKRLGRGKGFYDRYLEKSSVVKIGIAFEMQITEDIPVDEHDVLMDFVVTDKSLYKK